MLLTCIPDIPKTFPFSAAIFAGGDSQIRIYQHTIFREALEVGRAPVLVEVFFRRIGGCTEIESFSPVEYSFFKERDKM